MRKVFLIVLILIAFSLFVFTANALDKNFDYLTIVENHESTLPILYINVEGKSTARSKIEYKKAYMKIVLNDEYANSETYEGEIEIKARGNSTYNLPKKPYKIKLDKSTDLFGMGKDKHWVLLAQYFDEALMRNKLVYDFSGVMGLEYCKSTWVDLVFNGEYIGVYQICEQIRVGEERIDIADWEEEGERISKAIAEKEQFFKDEQKALEAQMEENLEWLTSRKVSFNGVEYAIDDYYELTENTTNGGLVFEIADEYNEVSKFRTRKYYPVMIKEPKYAKTNTELFDFAKNYINSFEEAVYATDGYAKYDGEYVHYKRLGDVDSLAKTWLCAEIFFNLDALYKSRYMYLDNDGSLLKFGPVWDFDYSTGAITDWDTVRPYGTLINRLGQTVWYDELFKDPYFAVKVCDYYDDYREEIINIFKDGGLIDSYDEYLKEAGEKNTAMWQYSRGYTDDVEAIKNWLEFRIDTLDLNFDNPRKLLSKSKKYSPSSNITITVYDKHFNENPEVIQNGDGCYILIETEFQSQNSQMKVYVNGIYIGDAIQLTKRTSALYIDAEYLDELSGHRNVITIRTYRNNSLGESNFACVVEECPSAWYLRVPEFIK